MAGTAPIVPRPDFRLYVDEVGSGWQRQPQTSAAIPEAERYLSLTGVVMRLDYAAVVLQPQLESLKREFFVVDPDEPLCFHRTDIVRRRGPFRVLNDPAIRDHFDRKLLALVRNAQVAVITACLDKRAILDMYGPRTWEPYENLLLFLMERFVLHLEGQNARGDVMAEARTASADKRLAKVFRRIRDRGSAFIPAVRFGAAITSGSLKLKKKTANVAGLQLADLLAHPSHRLMLSQRGLAPLLTGFAAELGRWLMQTGYRRSAGGEIGGFGTKFRP